jgi:hypothetical protein
LADPFLKLRSASTQRLFHKGRLNYVIFWTLVAASTFILVAHIFNFTYANLNTPWTSVRLAPTFAMWEGYPLYSTVTKAPWVMVGYGPLYPLMYAPSILFSTPAPAVATATLLAHTYILLPLCLLIRIANSGESRAWLHAIMGAVLIYPFLIMLPSLRYVTTSVHADAPALGFLLLGGCVLLRHAVQQHSSALRAVCLAGVLIGFSLACKPNLAPAGLAFASWCFWFYGLRAMVGLLGCAAVALTIVFGVTCITSDPRAILLNFQILAAFPWGAEMTNAPTGKVQVFFRNLLPILKEAGPVVIAVVIALHPAIRSITVRQFPAKPTLVISSFFLVLALTMLIPAVASFSKFGGDVNSLALFTLPLTIAAIFALMYIQGGIVSVGFPYLMLILSPGILLGIWHAKPWQIRQLVDGVHATALGESYSIAMQCKNTCYLPFDPLAHILESKTFRPNIDVIHSYSLGGHPVDQKAFASYLPGKLEQVIMPKGWTFWGLEEVQRLLPNFVPSPEHKLTNSMIVLVPLQGK